MTKIETAAAIEPEGPITPAELVEWFGSEMPVEVVNLVWNAPPDTTFSQVRKQIRAMAVDCAAKGASPARWVLGRVQSLPEGRALVTLDDDREHVITRAQAVALGTRLLEVGIGTSFTDERAINARIGDIISEWRQRQ